MGLLDRLPFKKKPRADTRDVRLAMVTLAQAAAPRAADFQRALADVWPHHPPVRKTTEQEGTLGLELGPTTVMLGLMPASIPWRDLELVAHSAFDWPEATEVLQAHRAHVVVSALGPPGDKVDGAMLLTRVTAAVALQEGATGVYWGEAPQVSSAQTFVEAARAMSREQLPLHQWLGFPMQRTSEGRVSLATSGMRALGFMELEFVEQRAEAAVLVDRAFNVAHYLLDRGPVLKDGDTVGLSAEERIRVRHAPSVLDPPRTVYRLEL